MIKEFSNFMVGSFSLDVTTLPGLVSISLVLVDIVFLIHHVASSDHVFEDLYNFVGGKFSWYFTTLESLVAIALVVGAI